MVLYSGNVKILLIVTLDIPVLSINLSVSVFCYVHNSCTCIVQTLCEKISVGHICSMVLGVLVYTCPVWGFTCFFGVKQTVSTSCLNCIEIHVYYSVSFHMVYIFHLMMMSGVHKSQETKFCRGVPEYGVCFLLHFWQYNFEISSRFLDNLCTHDVSKE